MNPLASLDDRLLALAQKAVVSASHAGIDKFEIARDVHILKVVFSVSACWYAIGGVVLGGPLLAGFFTGNDLAWIRDRHRRIGQADTVRGWKKAASEAGASVLNGRNGRMFAIARTTVLVILALVAANGTSMLGTPASDLVPVFSCLAVHGLLVVAAGYLRAAIPPPPTSFRREEDIPMRVADGAR